MVLWCLASKVCNMNRAKLFVISIGWAIISITPILLVIFIIQWIVLAVLHAKLLLWWCRFLVLICLSCSWFYQPLYVKLINSWWCFDFGCDDLSWIIYFLELFAMEARPFKAWKGFLKMDFRLRPKMRSKMWFFSLCRVVMCLVFL